MTLHAWTLRDRVGNFQCCPDRQLPVVRRYRVLLVVDVGDGRRRQNSCLLLDSARFLKIRVCPACCIQVDQIFRALFSIERLRRVADDVTQTRGSNLHYCAVVGQHSRSGQAILIVISALRNGVDQKTISGTGHLPCHDALYSGPPTCVGRGLQSVESLGQTPACQPVLGGKCAKNFLVVGDR